MNHIQLVISNFFNSHNPNFYRPEKKKPFENIMGKDENAGNQHFLFFPQCFPHFTTQILIFKWQKFCCLQMLCDWTSLQFCRMVKI